MYLNLDWQIKIDGKQLAVLESCEVHRSIDLLADTCTIKLPAAAYAQAPQLKRGQPVDVKMGYDADRNPKDFRTEFKGFLLNVSTDDEMVLHCEDGLFLLRVAVKDKQFKNASTKAVAQYLIDQTKAGFVLNCTQTIGHEKFVIHQDTAYDVLKRLQDETGSNIYMRWLEATGKWELNIHPPYDQQHGTVRYSFQQNIEESSLNFINRTDRRLQVVIESITPSGKKKETKHGPEGGDSETIKIGNLDAASAKKRAEQEWKLRTTDGYEGDITTWLDPLVEPGYHAELQDEEYDFKNGTYYVAAVTTTISASGGSRKVQLGVKTKANG